MIRPDRGPATKTRAIRDLLRPREMRYGDATQVLGHTTVGKGRFIVFAHRMPFRRTTSPANPRIQW
jgi:hypothetical protein